MITLLSKGITAQPNKAKEKVIIGEIKNIIKLEERGIIDSFDKSFTPSAIGWNNPNIPTTFGPRLRWVDAKTLRSKSVKKATANKTGRIRDKQTIKTTFW